MLSKMRSLVKKRLIKIPETLTAVGGGGKIKKFIRAFKRGVNIKNKTQK